ncbi:hypothetical protein EIK77_000870 [Talaromyces pinophilus]|nr:hypothetical protein EIK77_000870 [Talaromyces pinophilus]
MTENVASSARIRDNQRRSRARHKEYVRDLEQRLRRFESLGVEASREIQAAGRKVATENALLRSLLRRLGVAEKEVQGYLESHATYPIPPTTSLASPPPLIKSRPPATDRNNLKSRDISQLNTICRESNREPNYLLREIGEIRVRSPPELVVQRHPNLSHPHASGANRSAAGDVRNSIEEQTRARQDMAHSTSCETAANLIITMRGYTDISDVRSELGCHSESNCTVRNMDIFEILDK